MKKIIILIVISLFVGFVFAVTITGNSKNKNISQHQGIYTTSTSNIIIGGMSSDKDKLDSFKRDLERDNEYSMHIEHAYNYKKIGSYKKSIDEFKKALSIYPGDSTAHEELADLYEKIAEYELSINEYNWAINRQKEAYRDAVKRNYKSDAERRQKLILELIRSRKHVEELKAKAEAEKK